MTENKKPQEDPAEAQFPFLQFAKEVSGAMAQAFIQRSLNAGKMIEIAGERKVITPDGRVVDIVDLTEEELAANPHISR